MTFCHCHPVLAITPAHGAGERDATATRFPHDGAVPRFQPRIAQRQSPQPVVSMRIDPGLIQDQVGAKAIKRLGQHLHERRKIIGVTHPVGKRYVQRRPHLAHGEIPLRMDGQRENIVPPLHQLRGAIALMHVEVENQHPPRVPFPDQSIRRDGQVIEHAITRAAVVKRMMTAPGRVGGIGMKHRQLGRGPGSAGRQHGPPHHPFIHRKTDPPFLFGRHIQAGNFLYIGGIVHGLDPVAGHDRGFMDGKGGATYPKCFHNQPIFIKTKAAAACGRGNIGRMVNDMEHHLFSAISSLNDEGFALSGPA